jgi:hypothetical protein
MDKFKKIGLTALGTTLVASSAIAADATVTGSTGYTYSSEEVGTSTTDGIGFYNNMKMVVSGEMDNGWSSTGSMLLTEDAALSSSWASLTMGGLGTIVVGNGYGGLGAGFDDATPRAFEENHDGMKTTTAMDSLGASHDDGQILYNSPSIDLMGASVSFGLEYAPEASDAAVGDGEVSTSSNLYSSASGASVNLSYGPLSAGAYGYEISSEEDTTTVSGSRDGDPMGATWFVNYSAGPVSVGYQVAGLDMQISGGAEAATTAKTVAAATGYFEAEQISLAFNVNDDLSVGYGERTETYNAQDDAATAIANVDMESKKIEFAYTMGSMALKGYQIDTDNPGWDSDASSDEVTELSLTFSF